VLVESPDRLQAVHSRHEDVDDHDIERAALHLGDAAPAVFGHDDVESIVLEDCLDGGAYRLVIIDDENPRHGAGPSEGTVWWEEITRRRHRTTNS
jgi:hypothetical protein